MKLAVNGRFEGRRLTGVDRYATEIVGCLGGRARLIKPRATQGGLRGHLWEQFVLPRWISSGELLWSPANSGPLVLSRQVVTIHDLSVLHHPEWFAADFVLWYRLMLPRLARKARHVLTVSEHSRQDMIQTLAIPDDKVTAVPNGVDLVQFSPRNSDPVRRKYGLGDRYVLFVGSIDPRKNLTRLLAAWNRITDGCDAELVIVGGRTGIFRPVPMDHSAGRVRVLGYVADDDLAGLYSGATFFVMPSLFEGFGLSVLEAMACGSPVIASNAGALPEVTAGAALQVDPYSIDEIEAAMRTLLEDESLCQDFRIRGLARAGEFSWRRSAERIWEVLSTIE